jgi:hypothetical protein
MGTLTCLESKFDGILRWLSRTYPASEIGRNVEGTA